MVKVEGHMWLSPALTNEMSYSLSLLAVLSVLLVAGSEVATRVKEAPKLGKYNVNANETSVTGLSSGAFMAVQFHVAFSKTIVGAGITAGGPFYCAQDDVAIALSACEKKPDDISVTELIAITYSTALTGTIDPPEHMKGDKVFLVSGTKDTVVAQGVMDKLAEYYTHFDTVMYEEFSLPAVHSQITNDYGNPCDLFSSPYIINCNYSSADHMLNFIYSGLKPATSGQAIPANLLEFDQKEFFIDLKVANMDDTGYVYVPTACQNMTACRLLIAFHGCLQGRQFIADTFALHAGYNAMAEVNNFIVLYPQTKSGDLNPYGCWDWWGYTGPDYACKLGLQMAGAKLMMDRVAGL